MSCSQQDLTIEASGERCTELRLVIAAYIIITTTTIISKNTKYFLPDLHKPVHCETTSILYYFEEKKGKYPRVHPYRPERRGMNKQARAGWSNSTRIEEGLTCEITMQTFIDL